MSWGFSFDSASYENPSLSSAPGRKFSVSTSAFFSSLRTRSRPSGFCRSTARLFLLRLNTGKKPAPAASSRRVLSPASGSTLITSAPRSASASPQEGPITMCANSTTRTPSSGSTESFGDARQGEMAVGRFLRDGVHHQLARRHQLVEVDAGLHAHRLEHEHQVFGDDVAARAGRERAAAEPAKRTVEMAHAFLVSGERIGQAQAAGVVQMSRLELPADLFSDSGEEALDLCRVCVAHRIGQADAVTELGQRNRDAHHVVLRHCALQRATERGGHRAFNLDAGMRMLRALAHFLHHLLRRHAHVGLAVLAARRDREGHLVRAGLQRALETFQVWRQRNDLHVGKGLCKSDNLRGVGHGRDQLRRHERADLDFLQAGRGERRDPRFLRLGRHEVMGVLQPVARADFANVHVHDLILFSIMPIAMPQSAAPAANASSAHRLACQPPKWVAIQASASGPRNWPIWEACITMPLAVPMCCGVRACTGRPANTHAGITPMAVENTSTSAKRMPAGSKPVSMPTSQSAAIAVPAMTKVPRGTPRARSQPPPRLPGMLVRTKSAVISAAAPLEARCSSIRNVGSQTMIEVHCAT